MLALIEKSFFPSRLHQRLEKKSFVLDVDEVTGTPRLTAENASTAFWPNESESQIGLLCDNDPMDFVDPMGLELEFPEGFETLRTQLKAYAYKTSTGKQIWDHLDSKNSPLIKVAIEGGGRKTGYEYPKEGASPDGPRTIHYNPTKGLNTENGGTLSPQAGFMHEGKHGYDETKDRAQFFRDQKTLDRRWKNESERKAIQVENESAAANGETGKRKKYSDGSAQYVPFKFENKR